MAPNKSKYLFLLVLLIGFSSYSQQLRIGVLRDYAVKQILFSYNTGSYSIYGDSLYLGSISSNEFVDIVHADSGTVYAKKGGASLGTFKKILLIQNELNTSITLNTKVPNVRLRKYMDDFEVTASDRDLKIVNLVDMDHYLAGVVESEGGGRKELEYYKAQAIMSRTYALKYSYKHRDEGFELCDRVHCQAYHSMNRFTPKIDTAVMESSGIVLLDDQGKYLDAYFHANCGGQTALPEHVWNNSIPYLSTFKDTFCIYTHQATWTKRISKVEWRKFIVGHYQFPIDNPEFASYLYNFKQSERLAFYVSPVLGIPLRDIRMKFRLKSTYFSCREEGSEVVLEGRGFGHGVGLCQEGAMKMAKYDFHGEQIIKFYFPGAVFLNMKEDQFFAQSDDLWYRW
jgi:stage II sporulation protein D